MKSLQNNQTGSSLMCGCKLNDKMVIEFCNYHKGYFKGLVDAGKPLVTERRNS